MSNGVTNPYWFHLPLACDVLASVNAIHGPLLFPGKGESLGPQHAYFCNFGDSITLTLSSFGLVTAAVVTLLKYEPSDYIPISQITLTPAGPTQVWPITSMGYYAIKISEPTGVPPTTTIAITAQMRINNFATIDPTLLAFGQLALPQVASQFPLLGPVRIQGASLMFTQTTPQLQRGGTVTLAQITQSDDWDEYITFDSVENINPQLDRTFDATNGCYAFLKPSDERDFNYISEFELDVNNTGGDALVQYDYGVKDSFFQITPTHDYLTANVKLPAPIVNDSRSGYWTLTWKIEYETNDQWRNLAIGRFNSRDVNSALAFLAAAPQFHSNSLHIKELYDWMRGKVKDSASFISEHGPELLAVIQAVLKGATYVAALA